VGGDQLDEARGVGGHAFRFLKITIVEGEHVVVEVDQGDLAARLAHGGDCGGETFFVQRFTAGTAGKSEDAMGGDPVPSQCATAQSGKRTDSMERPRTGVRGLGCVC
jgi:hypothetical protein